MDPLTLTIWVGAVIAMISVGFAFLPSGANYPLPDEMVTGIHTLYGWLHSFNELLPVDTLVKVLIAGMAIKLTLKMLWPSMMWVIKTITGAGQ